jgi:hypothetical protein
METFDSGKSQLVDILKEVTEGKIQLPDFQRGWIWDDYRIKALIASIAKSFPIGAIMLLETGNPDVKFKTRYIEGVTLSSEVKPEKLILDGQQRITSLYQAIISEKVVKTRNEKGFAINRWYYINMQTALDEKCDVEDAILPISENKKVTEDFGRKLVLDLSTSELEYQNLMFPINKINDYHIWRSEFNKYWRYEASKTKFYDDFEVKIINNFSSYSLPIINMKKINSKEAVCQVFEKVNTGGVALNVFELLTATFAAEEFDLRNDWSEHQKELQKHKLLTKISNTDFIQSITLLSTYIKRCIAVENKIPENEWPAVGCKRKDMLALSLDSYKELAKVIRLGFINSAKLLKENNIFKAQDIPYQTQLIPLAAIFAALDNPIFSIPEKEKLNRWFWCGVLGELYGGTNETRYSLDIQHVIKYLKNDEKEPKTIFDANFSPSRLETLRTRNSAAYKGIYALLMKDGAKDFYTGTKIDFNTYDDEAIDIHHIFPKAWCEKNEKQKNQYDSIVNKTPLSARTNKIIGGSAPGLYLEKLEKEFEIPKQTLIEILNSHVIDSMSLYTNNFEEFMKIRTKELLDRISKAMGKEIYFPKKGEELEESEFIGTEEELNV